MHKPIRTLVSTAIIGILSTGAAHAGGFSLYNEGNASSTGNYGAGLAAEAADASIGWFNPAGLVLIKDQQVVLGGVGIFPSLKLTGSSTFRTNQMPDYVQNFDGLQGGENGFVPSFHYALPLGENAAFGFSVVAPFGLATDWGVYSPVRYQATFSEIITTDFSPELGAKITDNFSIGGGIDLQYARVKLNTIIGLPTFFQVISPFNPYQADSLVYNKGNSFAVGFHAGVMGMFNDNHTRVGVNYQSKVKHNVRGYSQLTGLLASPGVVLANPVSVAAADPQAVFRTNDLSGEPLSFPDIVNISAYHDLNERFALLGSVVYTGWNSVKTLAINNVAAASVSPNPMDGLAVSQVKINTAQGLNYKDAWRVSVGANYHVNTQWMLRAGGGCDATPINDLDRDIRLPDADRCALAIGAHYQMNPRLGVDVGYTYMFATEDVGVNRTTPLGTTASYTVNAVSKATANLVGAQVVWNIDTPVQEVTK